MDKTLIKLYLVIALAAALMLVVLPNALGHTAAWTSDTLTRARLAAAGDVQPVSDITDKNKGEIVFVMDDGWETQYTAGYALLQNYGYKGCVAVIPAAVGMEGYMTYHQLADMYLDGWDLLNHTYNHISLPELPEIEQAEQMKRARKWLHARGFKRGADVLVFPGGSFDETTTQVMKKEGFTAGRSLKSLWDVRQDCSVEDVELCNLISGMPIEHAIKAADKAMNNGSAVIFMLHKIEPVTDGTYMQIDEPFLKQLLDYISANADRLSVVTITQLLSSYYR